MKLITSVLLLTATLVGACSSADDPAQLPTSDKRLTLVKLDAARRALREIEARKDRGLPVYADCKTAQLLFVDGAEPKAQTELAKMARRLRQACSSDRPAQARVTP